MYLNLISLQAGPEWYGPLGMGFLGFMLGSMLLMFALLVGLYVYTSFTLMKVAERLKTKPAWLAWVPIGNLYLMSKMAKMQCWPILLLLAWWIPVLGQVAFLVFAVFAFIWMWKILEARKRPGWWSLFALIPMVGLIWYLVMWGILAWSKK